MRFVLLASVFLSFVCLPAFASDGRGEINQTCAVSTGCFPGDTAGFPVTIKSSGSYVLTSSLQLPAGQDVNLVEIDASDVSVDLNGFTVTGLSTGSTNRLGIESSAAMGRVRIENGFLRYARINLAGSHSAIAKIRSTRSWGVRCGSLCLVEDVGIATTGNEGALTCGSRCTVVGLTMAADEHGVICEDHCSIRDSKLDGFAYQETVIAGDYFKLFRSSVTHFDDFHGISAGAHALIEESSITGQTKLGAISKVANSTLNTAVPIVLQEGSSVSDVSILRETFDPNPLVIEAVTKVPVRLADSIVTVSDGSAPVFSLSVVDAGGNVCAGSLGCP